MYLIIIKNPRLWCQTAFQTFVQIYGTNIFLFFGFNPTFLVWYEKKVLLKTFLWLHCVNVHDVELMDLIFKVKVQFDIGSTLWLCTVHCIVQNINIIIKGNEDYMVTDFCIGIKLSKFQHLFVVLLRMWIFSRSKIMNVWLYKTCACLISSHCNEWIILWFEILVLFNIWKQNCLLYCILSWLV